MTKSTPTYANFIRAQAALGRPEPIIWRAMKRRFALPDATKRRYIKWYLPPAEVAPRRAA